MHCKLAFAPMVDIPDTDQTAGILVADNLELEWIGIEDMMIGSEDVLFGFEDTPIGFEDTLIGFGDTQSGFVDTQIELLDILELKGDFEHQDNLGWGSWIEDIPVDPGWDRLKDTRNQCQGNQVEVQDIPLWGNQASGWGFRKTVVPCY